MKQSVETNTPGSSTHLGGQGMRSPSLQQHRGRLHLPLPGGDVEGGCSRCLWQHQDGPCAGAAAGQSQFFPDGMQYVGESGPPTHDQVKRQ